MSQWTEQEFNKKSKPMKGERAFLGSLEYILLEILVIGA